MLTAAPGVVTTHERCRRCSRFRSPREFVAGPYGYCLHCYENHRKALAALASGCFEACQECGKTWREVAAGQSGDDIRMEMHLKDGLYQLLCKGCSAAYAAKRLDLYGRTPWAKQIGIDA